MRLDCGDEGRPQQPRPRPFAAPAPAQPPPKWPHGSRHILTAGQSPRGVTYSGERGKPSLARRATQRLLAHRARRAALKGPRAAHTPQTRSLVGPALQEGSQELRGVARRMAEAAVAVVGQEEGVLRSRVRLAQEQRGIVE